MSAKIKSLLAVFLISALFAGCRRTGPGRLHAVYVIDLTASTLEESRKKAFIEIKEPFDKGLVKRGDSITVIPITGDALTESQGAILRFEIPANREVYDEDLNRLSEQVVEQLQNMERQAAAKPYLYSDIIGAVKIAAEEFATDKPDVRKVLVVMSDLVHDVKQLSFKTAPIVANDKAAEEAAKKLANGDRSLSGVRVYLGLLRSTDLKSMSAQRRAVVENLWMGYFKQAGASQSKSVATGRAS